MKVDVREDIIGNLLSVELCFQAHIRGNVPLGLIGHVDGDDYIGHVKRRLYKELFVNGAYDVLADEFDVDADELRHWLRERAYEEYRFREFQCMRA